MADTSAFGRLSKANVAAALTPLAAAGAVALCVPVVFELCFTARSPKDYAELLDHLRSFAWLPVNDGCQARALEIQEHLASRSQQRAISLVDALVASVAEAHGLTVLHYDADFELIASFTGQSQKWVVPRGTAD